MALDRQSIERKDFPIGRRGYDRDAVDAHLRALADEIDELKRSAGRGSESVAVGTSEQVRSIVEAAEISASEIRRRAEDEARETRAEANSEAQAIRGHAAVDARAYVGRVSDSAAGVLERIDAMESQLRALIESLRSGSNRLGADLQLLEGNLAAVKNAVVPRPHFELEHAPGAGQPSTAAAERAAPGVPTAEPFEESVSVTAASAGEVLAGAPAETPPAVASAPRNGADDDSARLIALDMALKGIPREETDKYLADNFKLTDRMGLLDQVYSVEG